MFILNRIDERVYIYYFLMKILKEQVAKDTFKEIFCKLISERLLT